MLSHLIPTRACFVWVLPYSFFWCGHGGLESPESNFYGVTAWWFAPSFGSSFWTFWNASLLECVVCIWHLFIHSIRLLRHKHCMPTGATLGTEDKEVNGLQPFLFEADILIEGTEKVDDGTRWQRLWSVMEWTVYLRYPRRQSGRDIGGVLDKE